MSDLWVDKYAPQDTTTLAVHRAKIDQVRTWLAEALDGSPALRAYRRLLVLTGPSGSGKSATVRALASAQELNFDLVEWGNNIRAAGDISASGNSGYANRAMPTQSSTQLFADFLVSSSRFGTLSMNTDEEGPQAKPSSSAPSSSSQRLMPPPPAPAPAAATSSPAGGPSTTTAHNPTRRVILLDDLPNLSHLPTRNAFQATLATLLAHTQAQAKQYAAAERALRQHHQRGGRGASSQRSSLHLPPPILLLLSDSTGRESDASIASDSAAGGGGSGSSFGWRKDEELSIRTVLGDELRRDPRVSEIKFNPVAPTILKKALIRVLDLVHAEAISSTTPPPTQARLRSKEGAAAAPSSSSSRRSKSSTTPTTTRRRDKSLEAELVRLLASADEIATVDGDHNPTPAAASAMGSQKNKVKVIMPNRKRTSVERPTGGDLRSAITQLQFVLEHAQQSLLYAAGGEGTTKVGASAGTKRDRSGKGKGKAAAVVGKLDAAGRARYLLSTVSRRESNLPLFHAVGRVLWNKRVGDPGGSDDEDGLKATQLKKEEGGSGKGSTPSASQRRRKASAKKDDEEEDEGMELGDSASDEGGRGDCSFESAAASSGKQKKTGLNRGSLASKLLAADEEDGEPWPDLPPHWADLRRRPSKINTEALWAQSPVDSSLLQLYLHANFPSFCAEIEECSAGLEYISAADSDLRMWTESWTHASLSAYYSFLVSTGGILLSLPSPIPPLSAPHSTAASSSHGSANNTPFQTSLLNVGGKTRHRQIRKSAFFDAYKRTREMGEALDDAQDWLLQGSRVAGSVGTRRLGVGGRGLAGGGGSWAGAGSLDSTVTATIELSSLSTVPKRALAIEVLPLLAKLGFSGAEDSTPTTSKGSAHRPHQRQQVLKSSASSSSSGANSRFPACIARVGQFDHLTVAQAVAVANSYSLRTEVLDDSGLIGGAGGEEDDVDAGLGGVGTTASADEGRWKEQVKSEEPDGLRGRRRGGEEGDDEQQLDSSAVDGLDPAHREDGASQNKVIKTIGSRYGEGQRKSFDDINDGGGDETDPGLMDSDDEVTSDW
ncbi:hypothetical protein V8E36_005629 [Tilletia maclaganii]